MGALIKKPLPIGGGGGHVVYVTTKGIEIVSDTLSCPARTLGQNTMSIQDTEWMIVLLERGISARRADMAARRKRKRRS